MILKNFKTDNTGSLPLIGMMNAYAPVYYLRGLTIDNGTFTDEAFSTVIDPGPTTLVPIPYTTKYLRKTLINSVSRKSTIFENVDIENASVSDELLNLTKYSFYDEERFERGNGVYFKGKNIFKGITVGSNANYMIYVDTNVKFIGADSKTTVKENLKRQYVDTSAHNSYVYVSGEMTISGIFEVVDNEFEFNTAPGTVSSAVYYRSPSNKVVVKDGGFSVNGNEAVGPAAASARVRQFHMSYDLSRKADGTRLPNNTHKMVNENTALIDVPEGYKFKASESTLYIYSEDRSGVYNEQCLISTWSILKVEHYNESESTQIISTFFRDDDHNNDPAWINDRRVYKKKRGIVEKAMLGNEYIEVAAILFERQPGDIEETKLNARFATVSYQTIAKADYTQIEKPLGRSTYRWNDGTTFTKDLSQNVFWVGPNRNYQVPGDKNYKTYEVFNDDFSNAIASLSWAYGDPNFYIEVSGSKRQRGFYIYGYESVPHNHVPGADIENTHTKTYWLEARNESHLNVDKANIVLKRDIVITRPLTYPVRDEYSICLNGHTLTFANIDAWVKFNDTGSKFVLTNCMNDGTTANGYVTANTTLTGNVFSLGQDSGRLILSSISFLNMNLENSFIDANVFGAKDKIKTRNIKFDNINMNSTTKKGFINAINVEGTKSAKFMIGRNFNNLILDLVGEYGTAGPYPNERVNLTIEAIRWSKEAPTSGDVYDVSEAGNGAKVTDFTNITDSQILCWWDYAYTTIYLYTKADYAKLNDSASYMFSKMRALNNIDLSRFDTSSVDDMSYLFYADESLTELNLSRFNTANTRYMQYMFAGDENIESLDLSAFDKTNVTNETGMFEKCSSTLVVVNPAKHSYTFDRESAYSPFNKYATISDATFTNNTVSGNATLLSFNGVKDFIIEGSTFDTNNNLFYIEDATMTLYKTYVTNTTGAYIYDYSSATPSTVQVRDSIITGNNLTEAYSYASKTATLSIVLGGVVEWYGNTRLGNNYNLFVEKNKVKVSAKVHDDKLTNESNVWITTTEPEVEIFRGWHKDNVLGVNAGTSFDKIFNYEFVSDTIVEVNTLPASGAANTIYDLTGDIKGVAVEKYYVYNSGIGTIAPTYTDTNVRYSPDGVSTVTRDWTQFRNEFNDLLADGTFRESSTDLTQLALINNHGSMEIWWVGASARPAEEPFYSKGYYRYVGSAFRPIGGREKFYRENDKWYVGYDYVNVRYYIDDEHVTFKGNKITLDDAYIKRDTAGSLVDMPYTIATISEFDNKMSYLGFLGRDINVTNNTTFIPDWDFENDKVKGISYSKYGSTYQSESENSTYDRVLYTIFSDDKVKLSGRGRASRSVVERELSTEAKYLVLKAGKVTVATRSEKQKVFEYVDHNGIVARDNYILVATLPQLYYKYKEVTTTATNYYNTQYILGADLRVQEAKTMINTMGRLSGQRLIYMRGYDLYLDDERNYIFDAHNIDPIHPIYTENSLTIVGAAGSEIIYASKSDARAFLSQSAAANNVQRINISSVSITGGKHISEVISHSENILSLSEVEFKDMVVINGAILNEPSGNGKMIFENVKMSDIDVTGGNLLTFSGEMEIATDSDLIIEDNKVIGVKTELEEYYSDITVLADGVNSLLALKFFDRALISRKLKLVL